MKILQILLSSILINLSIARPASGMNKCTKASFYGHGDGLNGRRTASGQLLRTYAKNTTAHRHLPFGTRLKVVNTSNERSVIVTVNDRGPFTRGRGLDLSYKAFKDISRLSTGVVDVCYSILP